jgi:hypothetical protein
LYFPGVSVGFTRKILPSAPWISAEMIPAIGYDVAILERSYLSRFTTRG